MKNQADQQTQTATAAPATFSTSVMLQRAIELHQQGEIRQAAAMYLEILEAEPNNFDALHLLGIYALQTNDDVAAFDLIARALEIDPYQAMAYSNFGLALQRMKRFDEALAAYDETLKIAPDHLPAINNRGNTLAEMRRFDEAIVFFQRALHLSPEWSEALASQGHALLGLGRYQEAVAQLDRALAIDPELETARLHREQALQAIKESAPAA